MEKLKNSKWFMFVFIFVIWVVSSISAVVWDFSKKYFLNEEIKIEEKTEDLTIQDLRKISTKNREKLDNKLFDKIMKSILAESFKGNYSYDYCYWDKCDYSENNLKKKEFEPIWIKFKNLGFNLKIDHCYTTISWEGTPEAIPDNSKKD